MLEEREKNSEIGDKSSNLQAVQPWGLLRGSSLSLASLNGRGAGEACLKHRQAASCPTVCLGEQAEGRAGRRRWRDLALEWAGGELGQPAVAGCSTDVHSDVLATLPQDSSPLQLPLREVEEPGILILSAPASEGPCVPHKFPLHHWLASQFLPNGF